VIVHSNKRLKEIKGADGKVNKVILDDLTSIDADLVVIGAGIQPSTEWLGSAV